MLYVFTYYGKGFSVENLNKHTDAEDGTHTNPHKQATKEESGNVYMLQIQSALVEVPAFVLS